MMLDYQLIGFILWLLCLYGVNLLCVLRYLQSKRRPRQSHKR